MTEFKIEQNVFMKSRNQFYFIKDMKVGESFECSYYQALSACQFARCNDIKCAMRKIDKLDNRKKSKYRVWRVL